MCSRYTSALAPIGFLAICLIMTGCSKGGFDSDAIKGLIEAQPLSVDGEQVMLSDGQVQCGAQSELWDLQQLGGIRAIGRLNQAARNLHFGDDVIIGEPGMHFSYAQVRGVLQLRVLADVSYIRDEADKGKLADVKLGAEILHQCFTDGPLPLMAVRRGRFTQDALPTIRFKGEGEDWSYDRIMH